MYFNYTVELWRNGSPRFIDTWYVDDERDSLFSGSFYRVAMAAITTTITAAAAAAAVASLLRAQQIELFLSDLIPSCN